MLGSRIDKGVVISKETYSLIVEKTKNWDYSHGCDKFVTTLCKKFNLPVRTAASIISINFVRKMKYTHFRISKHPEEIWHQYEAAISQNEEPGVILRLSSKLKSSPALVAKILVEQYLQSDKSRGSESILSPTTEEGIGLSKTDDESRVKIPGEGRNAASRMIRDSSLINDGRLAAEILLCELYDDQYGHISEMYNRGIGEEFEAMLHRKAREAGLSVQSEMELRSRGYDKTPDLKLNVPVAVDGFVINWIESKGLFGDLLGHRAYLSEQYLSYWNRFGPGLVIYWLGFEDTIQDPLEKKFIVRCSFPDNITQMQPLLVSATEPACTSFHTLTSSS